MHLDRNRQFSQGTCMVVVRSWLKDRQGVSFSISVVALKFSVCVLKIRPEGSVSQISKLGPSFYFM